MAQAPKPPPAPATTPSLRTRTMQTMRAEITEAAIALFREQGYDETTVDQIVSSAGMSRTSFFRYFGSKEDVVLGRFEVTLEQMCKELAARPDDEPVWVSLRRAADTLIAYMEAEQGAKRRVLQALFASPSLRAREGGRRRRWQDLMAPEVARRMGVADLAADPRPQAVVGAMLACLAAAFEVWACAGEESTSLAELLDQAMSAPNG